MMEVRHFCCSAREFRGERKPDGNAPEAVSQSRYEATSTEPKRAAASYRLVLLRLSMSYLRSGSPQYGAGNPKASGDFRNDTKALVAFRRLLVNLSSLCVVRLLKKRDKVIDFCWTQNVFGGCPQLQCVVTGLSRESGQLLTRFPGSNSWREFRQGVRYVP
jgi:hypothetical protein